ncbi:hypothetical protein ACFL29_01025 [Patescibacteria group bacterium]
MRVYDISKVFLVRGPVIAVYDPKVRRLCGCAYYRNPDGCPKRGKKNCPPNAKLFVKDFSLEVLVVAIRFDFEGFLQMRRKQQPTWTERALRNQRHWQGHIRSILHKKVEQELKKREGYIAVLNPEARGVDVDETCKRANIILEWPPVEFAHEVALLAKPKIS